MNAANIMMKNIIDLLVGAIVYWSAPSSTGKHVGVFRLSAVTFTKLNYSRPVSGNDY